LSRHQLDKSVPPTSQTGGENRWATSGTQSVPRCVHTPSEGTRH